MLQIDCNSDSEERITIVALVVICLLAAIFLGFTAKDVFVGVTGGLIGYLKRGS